MNPLVQSLVLLEIVCVPLICSYLDDTKPKGHNGTHFIFIILILIYINNNYISILRINI